MGEFGIGDGTLTLDIGKDVDWPSSARRRVRLQPSLEDEEGLGPRRVFPSVEGKTEVSPIASSSERLYEEKDLWGAFMLIEDDEATAEEEEAL